MKTPTIESRNPSRRSIVSALAVGLPVAAIAQAGTAEASGSDAEILALADKLIAAENLQVALAPARHEAFAARDALIEKLKANHPKARDWGHAEELELVKGTPEQAACDAAYKPWNEAGSAVYDIAGAMMKMQPTTARGLAAYMLAHCIDYYKSNLHDLEWMQSRMLLLAANVGGFTLPAGIEECAREELERVAAIHAAEAEGGDA